MYKPVRIVKDFYDIFKNTDTESIEVNTNRDFISARIEIERLKKENFKNRFEVVIKNKKFSNGFKEIETFNEFVNIIEKTPRKLFENKLNIELPGYITDRDIIECELINDLSKFINRYHHEQTFEQNCLLFVLKLEHLDIFNSKNDIISFIISKKKVLDKLLHQKSIIVNWIRDEVVRNSDDLNDIDFFLDILQGKRSLDTILKSVLFNYIFRNYREFDKETLGKLDNGIQETILLNDEQIYSLYEQFQEYILSLDSRVRFKWKQISIFSEDTNFQSIINKASGVLESEYDIILKRLNEKHIGIIEGSLAETHSFINLIMHKFNTLFLVKPSLKVALSELSLFLDKFKHLSNLSYDFKDIHEWFEFYTIDYLSVYDYLRSDNIYKLLERSCIESAVKVKVREEIKEKIDMINVAYEEFLYENYHKASQNNCNLTTSNVLRHINTYPHKEKIILIVIDAMRWDMWKIIKNIFEDYGYIQTNEHTSVLSMIPSVTSVSRLSLFAVNKYKNIMNDKIAGNFSYGLRDEEKHLKRYFNNRNIEFRIGGKEQFNELIQKEADIYTFIFSDVDELFHGLKDIDSGIIKAIFESQIQNIINKINKRFNDTVKIMLATDHGSINIDESKSISLEVPIKKFFEHYNIKYDIHGKYLRIFSDEVITYQVYSEILDYFRKSGVWHIIEETDMNRFGLPNKDEKYHVIAYLLSKYGYHIGGVRGNNVHGGLSMNETITPFAVLEKRSISINDLEVSVEGEITTKNLSKLIISIYNSNSYEVHDLSVTMKPIYFEKIIRTIPQRSSTSFEVNILTDEEGKILNDVETSYVRTGKVIKQRFKTLLEVKEDPKSRISNSVKKSRSLDL